MVGVIPASRQISEDGEGQPARKTRVHVSTSQTDHAQGPGHPEMSEICMTPPLTELFAKRASTIVQGTVVGTQSRLRGQLFSWGAQVGSQAPGA